MVKHALEDNKEAIDLTKKAVIEESIDDYTQIIDMGLQRLKKDIANPKISAVAVSKIVGICFDKRQLLRGDPTQIEENNVNVTDEREADSLISALSEFAQSAPAKGPQGSSKDKSAFIRFDLPASAPEHKD